MGWLQRIFGGQQAATAETGGSPEAPTAAEAIPPERVGLNGEYDQSGLAKRVAQAFDQDATLDDIETLWVAQTSGTVVLKGKVPSDDLLQKCVSIASGVSGATSVDTSQVSIG
ncbi:MAG: BON domain-containing protein [Scytolyngbya sp. HA4215-MV1]|jgi:osmotically-inducible protein OsmY|nr:BON domain-containing protein [Scytolyngbya sp. HA4215-MV1]